MKILVILLVGLTTSVMSNSITHKGHVGNEIEEHIESKYYLRKNKSGMDHSYYRNYDQINAEISSLVAKHGDFMSLYSIGRTYEGRDMKIVKVSTGGDNDTKSVIFIDCGIHAREWISPASCLFFLDSLAEMDRDPSVARLLRVYEFHILTLVNPDGYDFSWTKNRLWRKNRADGNYPEGPDRCTGIDLNRNFDNHFGEKGSADWSCLEDYHGAYPFSESETRNMKKAIMELRNRIKMYFTIHSYGQLWIFPFGYTSEKPKDYDEMRRVAKIGAEAIEKVFGTHYSYGSSRVEIEYSAPGNSMDWAYATAGIVHSYTLELRDNGTTIFELPADQIEPTAIETWEGIKAAINALEVN